MYPAYHVTIKKIYLFALTSHNCDKVSAIHKYVSSYHVLLCPVSSLMGALDSYLTYYTLPFCISSFILLLYFLASVML